MRRTTKGKGYVPTRLPLPPRLSAHDIASAQLGSRKAPVARAHRGQPSVRTPSPRIREGSAQLVATPEVAVEALRALAEAGQLPAEMAEAWVYGSPDGPDEGTEPPVGGV